MSSSKKTTSTSATSGVSNVVQTPTNPAFVSSGLGQISGAVSNLVGQDPYSFVAGADPIQTQAATGAANLTSPSGFSSAQSLASGVGSANTPSIAGHLGEFMSPYTNDVVNTTLAGYDKNAGYSRAGDTLARAGDSTFGGSGGAIQTALNEQNIAQGRAQTEAQLRNQGFQTALGGATSQAGLDAGTQQQRLGAAGVMSGNASAEGANANQNIQTQSGIGQILQQLAQARAGAPINSLQSLSSIYGALPLGLLHGDTSNGTNNSTTNGTSTTTSSDPMGTLGSLAMGAGALMSGGALLPFMAAGGGAAGMGAIVSDRRLKWDIRKIGERADGLGVYAYRYLWSPLQHFGVMAQEVLKVKPQAVTANDNGYLAVNYGML